MDASAHPSPARPSSRPGDWASDDDYPLAALRDHIEGIVGFVLMVGPDGAPTQCIVRVSSGNAELDDATCRLMMQRAHFTPATDAAGIATTGTFSTSVRWKLPDDGKYSVPFPEEVRLEYDVAADGAVSNCRLTSSGKVAGYLAKDEAANRCAQLGPFSRQTDEQGKPVARHVVSIEANIITNLP